MTIIHHMHAVVDVIRRINIDSTQMFNLDEPNMSCGKECHG